MRILRINGFKTKAPFTTVYIFDASSVKVWSDTLLGNLRIFTAMMMIVAYDEYMASHEDKGITAEVTALSWNLLNFIYAI